MSVPLPSPSPLSPANPSTAKPIPRSRPQPISTGSGSPSINLSRSPLYREVSPGSPASPSSSLRKKTAKSIGFNAAGPASEDNWRERSSSVTSAPRSAVRTVGGFEKPKASLQPVKSAKEDGAADKDSDKAPALSHVPCRFFKAGACTAGSSCQFSHEDGGKREVCQWFLKGNCKFGHKCALAHVRPGEPMSMDRKNKKAAQAETRGTEGKSPAKGDGFMEAAATPVPIRSALSSSIQSPPAHRLPSSPLREPYGPPAVGPTGSSSPGFSKSPAPLSVFAASPSRPSPLSGSYGASKSAIPGSLSLKAVNQHSPLRPPATAFSSSFSHASIREVRTGTSPAPPLSASFADGMRKNIWARHETSTDKPEVLSPRRPINQIPQHSDEDYFNGELEDEDHGEDLIPSSLSDLLTPRERARRMSRRDSIESSSASPGRPGQPAGLWSGHGERLAQSAGPTMGPGFLQGLWSAEGGDARKDGVKNQSPTTPGPDGTFGYAGNGGSKSSLLSQMRSPNSPGAFASAQNGSPISAWSPSKGQNAVAINTMDTAPSPYAMRQAADPSSPSARALQEHNPGQSLPGGLASALSRLHMKGPVSNRTSGLAAAGDLEEGDERRSSAAHTDKADDRDDDELFTMDG